MHTKRLLLLLVLLGACAKSMSPRDAASAPMQGREATLQDEDRDSVQDNNIPQDPMLALEAQIQHDMISLGLTPNEFRSALSVQPGTQPGSAAGSYGFSTDGLINPTAKQPIATKPPEAPPKTPPGRKDVGKNDENA